MPAVAPAGPPPETPPDIAGVMAALGQLLGLAPSAVLRGRLARSAALLPALRHRPPAIDDPAWARLIDAVTVPETRLFRHPALLESLAETVLPVLGAQAASRPLQLVSAGCATGEEAYSLGMLTLGAGLPARVLGLDIARPGLAAAEAPCWPPGPPDPARDVPPRYRPLLERSGGALRPCPALRQALRFRRANLLDPLPLRDADLILCRNVLIYMLPEARTAVVAGLVAALRPGGALVLGATDSPPPGLGLEPWQPGSTAIWRRKS
ncbi:CheR family methyltransferase [Roseomonas marmotae]|uniref:CheR-type methyltransferase domain-containing protein n=1 Tax=Roseomonas marmotae TaxID=2768161 RepID=A0ABS3K763_9PROT|nr:CheR family methyltransferase [Roseomonas marmotae]MBO1073299.1 hypothetical protein [Roseomonas marmotae]QTI79083.1 hypothetical protein IAI58_15845 [Roseomonas marmotae]